jgi:multiple sugar transport system permease protein
MAETSPNIPALPLERASLPGQKAHAVPLSIRLTRLSRHALLLVAFVFFMFPIYYMVTSSLKTHVELFQQPPTILPVNPDLSGYIDLFANRQFGRALINSLIVVACSMFLSIVLGTLAAYSLGRFRLPWKLNGALAFWILSTRMLPPIVTIVPVYQIINSLRLVNTYAGLVIVYVTFSLPFAVWMMRSFVIEIPPDLEEAAMVDGASRLQAFWHVTLPLTRPGIVATSIFIVIDTYNEFLFALILTNTPAVMTVSVATSALIGKINVQWEAMNAGGTIAILPIVIFAMLLQRHLVRGLTLGAVK